MGGRALLQHGIETKRIERDEFDNLSSSITSSLSEIFKYVEVIPFYKNKKDFGDMDVLVSEFIPLRQSINHTLPNVDQELRRLFNPKVLIHNGSVWSFDQDDFQIDVIVMPMRNWDSALAYYSYNDLGNFMGRIARKTGFKYGHKGLTYNYKSEYGFGDVEIEVSKNVQYIFEFLGFDYTTFLCGFNTLEKIFEYIVESDYYDPKIFAYENLDHTNRVRNRKRVSYQKFIEYISKLSFYPNKFSKRDKVWFWQRALDVFGQDINKTIYDLREKDKVKDSIRQKFNGNIIMELTGLEGKQLGEFIQLFKDDIIIRFNKFDEYVLKTPYEEIKDDIKKFYETTI